MGLTPGTKSEDSIDDDFDDLDVASTETAEGESKGELGETSCLYEASEVSKPLKLLVVSGCGLLVACA